MSFYIQYNINQEISRALEFIAQTNGYLHILKMNPDWANLLERKAKMKEAISSIGVEGTSVSLEQATAITTNTKDTSIGEKEKREFTAYYDSLEQIKQITNKKLSLKYILDIHRTVTRGDENANPGKIRQKQNCIKSYGKIIYTPPPHTQLTFLMEEFVDWFNKVGPDKEISPIIAAAICHFWFVWIHPFEDGNGRVSRLLTTLLLLNKRAEGIKYFALSDYYNQDKNSYYDALEKVNNCDPSKPSMNFNNSLTSWLEFFVTSYNKQMKSIEDVTNRILQLNIRINHLRKERYITDNHDRVLSFLFSNEKTSYSELTKYLNVSKPRIHQILEPLRKANILIETKIGNEMWFKLGTPEIEVDESVFKPKLKHKSVDNLIRNKQKPLKQTVLPIFE